MSLQEDLGWAMLYARINLYSRLIAILAVAGAILYGSGTTVAHPLIHTDNLVAQEHLSFPVNQSVIGKKPDKGGLPCEMPGVTPVKFVRSSNADTGKRFVPARNKPVLLVINTAQPHRGSYENWPIGPPGDLFENRLLNHFLCRLRL